MPKHFHFGQTVQLVSSQDLTSYLGMGSHAWPIRNLSIPNEPCEQGLLGMEHCGFKGFWLFCQFISANERFLCNSIDLFTFREPLVSTSIYCGKTELNICWVNKRFWLCFFILDWAPLTFWLGFLVPREAAAPPRSWQNRTKMLATLTLNSLPSTSTTKS